VFWCLPPPGKCEWRNLRGFVQHLNVAQGANFHWKRCLDISERNSPQPEVLLGNPEGTQLVIERKSIVWPLDYLKNHQAEHLFSDATMAQLSPHFSESLHVLRVRASSLHGRNKAQIQAIVRDICEQIATRKGRSQDLALEGNRPIPWSFSKPDESEIDADTPDQGIGVFINENSSLPTTFDNVESLLSHKQGALEEILRELEKQFLRVSKKFSGYENCSRLLLVYFYCDTDAMILDQDFLGLIRSAKVPPTIDQVWVAEPIWVSETEWEEDFTRVR